MHVRVPKPLHGWSEFFHEVWIVVIGILIALILNQVVEQLNWDQRVDAAQRSIDRELALDAGVLDERGMQATCLRQTLAQLHNVIVDARRTGRIGYVRGGATQPMIRPIETSAWEAALADGTAAHFGEKRRQQFGILYPILADFRRQFDDEQRLWTHLRWLRGAPGKISDPALADVSDASVELDYRDWVNNTNSAQQLGLIRHMGIRPAYDLILDRPGTREEVIEGDRRFGVVPPGCTPVTADGQPVSARPSQG